MNILYLLIVAELFVFGWMWHNQSPQPERARVAEKPDPAVLFARRRAAVRKQSPD